MPLNYWNESVQNLQAATIDVSINEDINIMRNNVNDERFIDEFVDFKKFVTVEFQNRKLLTLTKKINILKETLWMNKKKNGRKHILFQK